MGSSQCGACLPVGLWFPPPSRKAVVAGHGRTIVAIARDADAAAGWDHRPAFWVLGAVAGGSRLLCDAIEVHHTTLAGGSGDDALVAAVASAPLLRVAVGPSFVLALLGDHGINGGGGGVAVACGSDPLGRLGTGAGRWSCCALPLPPCGSRARVVALPATLSPTDHIVELQLGSGHVLARTSTGEVLSWGANAHGQLGLGDTATRYEPCVVESLAGEALQVVAEGDRSYAVGRAGSVYAWGREAGALAGRRQGNCARPELAAALAAAEARVNRLEVQDSGAVVAYLHGGATNGEAARVATVEEPTDEAVLADDHVAERHLVGFWLWGSWGGERIDAPFQPWVSNRVPGNIQRVVAGSGFFLVLLDTGAVVAWGEGGKDGCLGLGAQRRASTSARTVHLPEDCGDSKVVDLQCGDKHVLALTSAGLVCAWGANHAGQLGLGDWRTRFEPTLVRELQTHRVVQVAAVGDSSYALTADGVVHAWGDNRDGSLGFDRRTHEGKPATSAAQEQSRVLTPEPLGLRGGPVERLDIMPPPATAAMVAAAAAAGVASAAASATGGGRDS